MPLIEVPDYAKLPDTLYDGSFKHINHDLYMFQYAPWFFDSRHALGWSRQIHFIKESGSHYPDRLVGDAFQKVEGNTYHLENHPEKVYSWEQLLVMSADAIMKLEQADVHIDAWGKKSQRQWLHQTQE